MVEHFVGKFNRLQGKSVSGVSREAMALLMAHDYPGNVRELENIIEHSFVLCGDGEIKPCHLPESFVARAPAAARSPGDIPSAVRAAEAGAIRVALERNGFNRLAAARELGLHKSTLFRKIKALGLELPPRDGRSGRRT
jgi:transcriptional regulator with PAS, ATPase and Fis domain